MHNLNRTANEAGAIKYINATSLIEDSGFHFRGTCKFNGTV